MNEEELFPIPVPALVAVLLNKENEKGSALTENEVNTIKENADCIMMPLHAYEKVSDSRGYFDIDPEQAWKEWQEYRNEYNKNS